jgi:hypothetical protein
MDPLDERGEAVIPTLLGRWETRLLLFATAGALVTAIFGLIFGDFKTTYLVLGYVLLFGFAWDVIYQLLVGFRWDQDWPTFFQVLAGIWEGAFVWLLLKMVHLPGLNPGPTLPQFLLHYSFVWLSIFVISQGPIRIFFVGWRYRGGEWL